MNLFIYLSFTQAEYLAELNVHNSVHLHDHMSDMVYNTIHNFINYAF